MLNGVAVLPRLGLGARAPLVPAGVLGTARALPRQAFASVLIIAVLATLGGTGHALDSGSGFTLQSRAGALHDRWDEMIAQGVPGSELAALQQQWDAADRYKLFWWPSSSVVIDGWQAETVAIWNRNVATSRAGAIAAQERLHRTLGAEPKVVVQERLLALLGAATPADYRTLGSDWNLQARLVPVNRDIASAVGGLTELTRQSKVLGILSDPAPDLLLKADSYTLLAAQDQQVHAEQLLRGLTSVKVDLHGRLDAAAIAKQGFGNATDELSLATAYGLGISGFQSQIDTGLRSFATATTVRQFNAITANLAQIVSTVNNSITQLRSTTHYVSGVSFYYQTHTLSCEEAATSMALTHQGIYLSQNQILAEMGADTRRMYVDGNGIVRWANPYESFAGNVNGSEHNYTGYGAFYPPLVRVAKAHGASVIAYGSMPVEMVYARLTAGHPVVVWATWDWAWHPRHDYLSFDGQWIPWIGPYADAHVYTAVGVSPGAVLVNDPLRGQYWVGKASFEAAYSDFQEAIVFA
jgi:uncharacterized protein YvpB